MFDANMRYLPKGTKFFAKVYSVDEESHLYDKGLRNNDLVYCEMLSENGNIAEAVVMMDIYGEMHEVREEDSFEDSWLVYAGKADGTDFINLRDKNTAMALMRLKEAKKVVDNVKEIPVCEFETGKLLGKCV